jgi:hypothetical protein
MLPVFFIASCGFEIPESLTVTGNPGVHLPLGSPFGASGKSINDYIGQDKIGEMISGKDPDQGSEQDQGPEHEVRLYDYRGDDTVDVQTYLVRYEIAKLNLNLQQHIKDADDITVPSLVIPALPGSPSPGSPVYITESGIFPSPAEPAFTIRLGAIEHWMRNIELNDTAGITIQGGAGLQAALRLRIPQLGIDNYREGEPDEDGNLVFTGDGYTLLDPNKDISKTIQVYAQLVGPPPGDTYPMELNFNWTTAILYPGEDGKFTDKYTINFGDFTTYLGNAKFKEVPAYVFIANLPEDTDGTMTLTGSGVTVTDAAITLVSPLEEFLNDKDGPVTGSIPDPSINNQIDLVNLFTAGDSSTLTYGITVKSVQITNTPDSINKTITAELLIKIPLEFEVIGKTVTVEGKSSSYTELELEPLKGITGSTGDLFGRTGKEDDLLTGIEGVELGFYNYTNTIIDGLSLFIGKPDGNGSFDGKLLLLNHGPEAEPPPAISYEEDEVAYPFNPQFKVLVESKDNEYSFAIRRLTGENAKLDFSLVLDGSAKIDQTINF